MTVRTRKPWSVSALTVAVLVAVTATVLPAWGAIFTDVQGLAAQRAIERLAAKGIFRIPGDGKFTPNATVPRVELAYYLTLALGQSGQGVPLPNFKDAAEIPKEMQPAVAATTSLASVSPQTAEAKKGALVYTLGADKRSYGPTDQVEIRFTISNTGSTDVQFDFANSQFYDFIIKDGEGNEVARWSYGRPFLPLDKPLTLAAGKKFEYLTRWRQLDQNDHQVPSGRYEITAVQTTKSSPTSLSIFFQKGLLLGFPDNTFRPKLEVTRADLAAVVVTAMGLGETSAAPPVTDAAEIPAALRGAVAMAIEKRIVLPGPDRAFRPARSATRADLAWALDALMDTMKRYDFSKGTLKEIRVGTPFTLIAIEDENKALRNYRIITRTNAIYRNNAAADLKDLKPGDALLFLKTGDVGDVTYIEATGR